MGYIILLFEMLFIVYRFVAKKSITGAVMFSLLFAPRIGGASKIDGFYIIAMLLVVLIANRRVLYKLPADISKLIKMIVVVNLIYLISWLIFSRVSSGVLITTLLGAVKIIIAIVACWEVDRKVKSFDIKKEIWNMMLVALIVNLLAIAYEYYDYSGSIQFLSSVFLNSEEQSFLNQQVQWGFYSRYFGIFKYPMQLGMFAVYSIGAVLSTNESSVKKSILILGFVVAGFFAGSKSFVLGMAVIVMCNILIPISQKKMSQKVLKRVLISCGVVIAVALIGGSLINYVSRQQASMLTHTLSYLQNWQGALTSRFGSGTGLLTNAGEFIKEYWLMGVGPASIQGEYVMDNAYYVIMHNGGILALMVVLFFYIKQFLKSNSTCKSLIIVILATGMGFQNLVAVGVTTWVLYYICYENSMQKYNA